MFHDIEETLDINMPASPKMLYIILVYNMDVYHDCEMGLEELGKAAGMSVTRVSTQIKYLKERGLVTVIQGSGAREKFNAYLVHFPKKGKRY